MKENKNNESAIGIYIRSKCDDETPLKCNIDYQICRLKEYCKKNNIDNIVKYVDIGVSANSNNKPAFKKMMEDIDKGIINKSL